MSSALERHLLNVITPYLTSPHPIEETTFYNIIRDLNIFLDSAKCQGAVLSDAKLFCPLIHDAHFFNSIGGYTFTDGVIMYASYCVLPAFPPATGDVTILFYLDIKNHKIQVTGFDEFHVYESMAEFGMLDDDEKKFPALIKE